MVSPFVIFSVALLPFTFAQTNNTNLQIEAIKAHFNQSQLVPAFLSVFEPAAVMQLNYPNIGDVTPGQRLTKDQTAPTPVVTVIPADASVALAGKYTIVMVDAEIVGADYPQGVNRHWLLNGATIESGKVTNTSGTAITAYAGPGPAAGSGPHRYVVILYQQPDAFKPPSDLSGPIGVTRFDLNAYVKNSGLGPLIAATYIIVEDGTATASIPATSSVVSSTLVASQSTTSKAAAGTTSANSPSQTNAAAPFYGFPPFAIVVAFTMIMVMA